MILPFTVLRRLECVMDLHRDAMAEIVALYVGLLCIDELGYKQLDHRCAVRLFQMLTEREEGAPWRSNPTSPQWLDQDLHRYKILRLSNRVTIVEIGTDSSWVAKATTERPT